MDDLDLDRMASSVTLPGAVHEKWLKLTQAARHGPIAPRSIRLADFMSRWLVETVQPDLAPTTAANYALFTRLYIGPDLGQKRLDRL